MRAGETVDFFDLQRFVEAQAPVYSGVLAELRRGRKESHWMWFIFPQLAGLGHSAMARHYAIGSLAEAKAYLEHPQLGVRLIECTGAVLMHAGIRAEHIFGPVDAMKLRSSMTLFAELPSAAECFERCLRDFFGGERDSRTLELLRLPPQ
jgi:uncharacterized protein (DUF1810 family)